MQWKSGFTRNALSVLLISLILINLIPIVAFSEESTPTESTTTTSTTESPLIPEELSAPDTPTEPKMPGSIEDTGTYFSINDSEYLNINFSSSNMVKIALESIPKTISYSIEAAQGDSSTVVNIAGFAPNTTYHKYEDNYHNHEAFTTDANGSYAYTQDLLSQHLVFIQPQPSTIFLNSTSGFSDPTVGTWDPATKTGTLIKDVNQTIQIESDGITLDGNGYTITVSSGSGVYITPRTGVTVKNVKVNNVVNGIYLYGSSNTTLTNNFAGIYLLTAWNNIIRDNFGGIRLTQESNYNLIDGNTANSNGYTGIQISNSGYNTVSNNTANFNSYGFYIDGARADRNNVINNSANSNSNSGIAIFGYARGNILDGNKANSNNSGISLSNNAGSTLRRNEMSGNNYNFNLNGVSDSNFSHSIDMTNLVDGKPIYYIYNKNGITIDSSMTVGTVILVNSSNITVKDLNLSKNGSGVLLVKTNNSRIENVTVSNNQIGIYLKSSSGNLVNMNNVNLNSYKGIYLYFASNSTVTNNNVNSNGNDYWNGFGIDLFFANNNQIYRNNFINTRNAYTFYAAGYDNIFNLEKPIGGNYWSNWTTPDADNDGFVDKPYVFADDRDNLPLTTPVSLNKEPAANFTYAPPSPTDLDTITFTDQSTDEDGNVTAWEWDFGDGTTSTVQNPTHRYADNGSYTVKLRVKDNSDAWSSFKEVSIDVSNVAPVADAGSDRVVDEGSSVIFSGQSQDPDGSITSYLWGLGDGISSSEISPSRTYTDNGTYPVNLTVTDNDGATSSDSANVTVNNVSPTVTTIDDVSTTWGESVSFNGSFTDPGNDTYTYLWDFGDGTTSTELNPTHTYFMPGTYTATLTVSDDDSGVGSDTVNISVLKKDIAITASAIGGEYSDTGNASATLTSNGSPLTDKTVNFYIDGQSIGQAQTDGEGRANLNFTLDTTAGNHQVSATFDGDTFYNNSSVDSALTVEKEKATLSYNGDVLTTYGSAVNLSANIAEESDNSPGDIAKAQPVEFILTDDAGVVRIVSANTVQSLPGIGTANATIENLPTDVYNITVRLADNNYYTANDAQALLVVYNPNGGFVTGGGWITNNGKKANFGFNARYQTDGTLQGEFTMIDRSSGSPVQIKSTSLEWLVVRSSTSAGFADKAQYGDQGIYDIRIDVNDNGIPGALDTIKITMSNGFIAEAMLSGGDIVIH